MSLSPTRRQVLAATAATTGTWIAPSILTIDRVGGLNLGSCIDQVLDWNAEVGVQNAVNAPVVVGGQSITVTNTTSIANSAVISPTNNFVTPFGTVFGGMNSWYELAMGDFITNGLYPAGSTVDVTFTFSPNVFDLSFSLLDIDSSFNFIDRVEITAFAGGTPGPGLTAVDPGTVAISGALMVGQQNVASPSTNGNVSVVFPGSLTTFSIRYTAGTPAGPISSQALGISNFNFCGAG